MNNQAKVSEPTLRRRSFGWLNKNYLFFLLCGLFLLAAGRMTAQNYIVTTNSGALVITDNSGNTDVLNVQQSGAAIRFNAAGRTYSLNGGPVLAMPVDVNIDGLSSITINAAGGNDNVAIAAFVANLPSVTVNGGIDNDVVSFSGDITFAAGANLDLDLQNDDASPGVDAVTLAVDVNLKLSGAGAATIRVSKNVALSTGSSLETVDGDLTIEANQQSPPTSGTFLGVSLTGAATKLQSTGSGAINVAGRGGGDGNSQGVSLSNGPAISGGSGPVTITGNGGLSTSGQNYGVRLSASQITSSGGNIQVTGTGGGSGTVGGNHGILMVTSSSITAGGSGTVTVEGTAGMGATSAGSRGVQLQGSNITTSGGNISVTGTGSTNTSQSFGFGVDISGGAQVSAGGNGSVEVVGTGGNGGHQCGGVLVSGAGTQITSSGGNVSVTGTGLGSTGGGHVGVWVSGTGKITAGGSGTVTVFGTGGNTTGDQNHGITLGSGNGIMTSGGGDITLTAIAGTGNFTNGFNTIGTLTTADNGGDITIISDNMAFSFGTVITGANNSLTLIPYTNDLAINLGSTSDPLVGPLSLSDAELDIITAGTLIIGDANSGNITVSTNITRSAASDIHLVTGGDVLISGGQINTAGGNLLLEPGVSPKAVKPTYVSTDISSGTLAFGGDLAIAINGTTVNTQYHQLNVAGSIDLTGVGLLLSGSHNPADCQTFTIISNDGNDAVTGTFNGLPEGAVINTGPFSTVNGAISYMGGDGNDVVISTLSDPPTGADAGPDQTDAATCGLTQVTLAANTPLQGSGAWTVVEGTGGSFGNTSSPTSTFSGTAGSTYKLRWTISTSCSSSSDDMFVKFNRNPSSANAGPDQVGPETCEATQLLINANDPVVGTGAWSIEAGSGGSFLFDVDNASNWLVGASGETYTLRWTISSDNCPTTMDELTLKFNAVTPVSCGPSFYVCPETPAFALDVASPAGGEYSGPGVSNGEFDPAGLGSDPILIEYVYTNSDGCTSNCFFEITVGDVEAPVVICQSIPVNLDGNGQGNLEPDQILDATYSYDNCGTINLESLSPNSFTCNDLGIQTLTLTANDGHGNTNTCSIIITVYDNLGPALVCRDVEVEVNLNGLAEITMEDVFNADESSDNCSSVNLFNVFPSSFSCEMFGENLVTLTAFDDLGNSSTCSATVTVSAAPVSADAGPDQTDAATCGLTTVTLAANTPENGVGTWSIESGSGGSFSDENDPGSSFSGLAGESYNLQWTVSSNPCISSSDEVSISFHSNPTTANAGPDQLSAATCGLTTVNLAANSPELGTGTWSIQSGPGGSFDNVNNPNASFSGLAGKGYILRWTVSNSPCNSSSDEVFIVFNRNPTTANAGPDQIDAATCDLTTVTLAANSPNIGDGVWSIRSGTGGSFSDVNDPHSSFSGLAGNTYSLRWTISNSPCNSSSDLVMVKFNRNPSMADAGSDQTSEATCGLTTVTMAANTPDIGSGTWTVESGDGGSFADENDPLTTFSGTAGATYTLRWTVENKPCLAQFDELIVTFHEMVDPTPSNAGPDQSGVNAVATLAANTPVVGTGLWTIVSGDGGSFGDPTAPGSSFSGTSGTTYVLRWTISTWPCLESSDEVQIAFASVQNDADGDGVANEVDNCPATPNPGQEDSDCDSVGDACDECDGGDDTVDNNDDGLPDCKYPPAFAEIIEAWKCGNNLQKVTVCHNGSQTKCFNYNALVEHLAHGDYIGSCDNAHCNGNREQESDYEVSAFEIYPNPAANEAWLNLSSFEGRSVDIRLMDVRGTMLQQFVATQGGGQALRMDLSGVPTGMYFVQVQGEGRQVEVVKLVVE